MSGLVFVVLGRMRQVTVEHKMLGALDQLGPTWQQAQGEQEHRKLAE